MMNITVNSENSKGYLIVSVHEGIRVIQQDDALNLYNGDDFQAGLSAKDDGLNVIQVKHQELKGWFVINDNENFNLLLKHGYLKLK